MKMILHVLRGVGIGQLFRLKIISTDHVIKVNSPVVFTNFLKLVNEIEQKDYAQEIHIDFTNCRFIDHTAIETLHLKDLDFKNAGGHLNLIGLNEFRPVNKSMHPASARIKK